MYNIHALIFTGMSTAKEKIVELNGYYSICYNEKSENIFYVVLSISFPYIIQEYVS